MFRIEHLHIAPPMRAREQGRKVAKVSTDTIAGSTHARAGAGTENWWKLTTSYRAPPMRAREQGRRLHPEAAFVHVGACETVQNPVATSTQYSRTSMATPAEYSRCNEGFPALQATGQKRVLTRDDNL